MQRTGLIVAHQLDKTEQTLLRVLGRAGEQKRAIDELTQIPSPPPLYRTIEETLTAYRAILESRGRTTPEDEELLMNLSTVYQNLKQDWRQENQLETAIVLLLEGVTIEIIQKATGLTIVQIQQLRDRLATGETSDSIIQ